MQKVNDIQKKVQDQGKIMVQSKPFLTVNLSLKLIIQKATVRFMQYRQ